MRYRTLTFAVMKHARENEYHAVTAWNFDTSVITVLENGARNMTILCNLSYVKNIEARWYELSSIIYSLDKMYVTEERLQRRISLFFYRTFLFCSNKISMYFMRSIAKQFNFKTILYVDHKYTCDIFRSIIALETSLLRESSLINSSTPFLLINDTLESNQ